MIENKFDVVVIGSGPGGYVCAIRLAQLGFKTAIIEKYKSLGGTCLNVGCIPSKSLLDSSHHYDDIMNHAVNHGIEISGEINLNFNKMIERKNGVVNQTVKGIDYLMNKNNITVFEGKASFVDNKTIKVSENKENNTYLGYLPLPLFHQVDQGVCDAQSKVYGLPFHQCCDLHCFSDYGFCILRASFTV